jgi:hypothetical protein
LAGVKVAPFAASHRLNSLLFTNQPRSGFRAALNKPSISIFVDIFNMERRGKRFSALCDSGFFARVAARALPFLTFSKKQPLELSLQ